MSAIGYCDGCGKERRDVRAVGRDSNGDADAPALCFLCRKTVERGKVPHRDGETSQAIADEAEWWGA